jgi:hypothetical protein
MIITKVIQIIITTTIEIPVIPMETTTTHQDEIPQIIIIQMEIQGKRRGKKVRHHQSTSYFPRR